VRFKNLMGRARRAVGSLLPQYSCPKSRHTYTQHQLVLVLLTKEFWNLTYRKTETFLEVAHGRYGLPKKIPHYTTPQKSMARISRTVFSHLIRITAECRAKSVAVDSTGFRAGNASPHYLKRLGDTLRVTRFYKAHIAVGPERKYVLAARVTAGFYPDCKPFIPLLKESGGHPLEVAVADAAYDSHAHYEWCLRNRILLVTPIRNGFARSKYRKRSRRTWAITKCIYPRRNLVECVNSVVKRRWGGCVRTRSYHASAKTILLRLALYNLSLSAACLVLYVFYRASGSRNHVQKSPV
jgi:hypothetical protein